MTRVPTVGRQFAFHATLENWAEGMDYCAIAVPAAITQALGTKGPVLVMAQVNDSEAFQVSLFPVGGGQHYIRIKAKVRQETRTRTGERIRVRITVLDRADVSIPEDLMGALGAEGVTEAFTSLPPGKQQFIIRRIDDAARPDTRERRIQEAVGAAHRRREATAPPMPAPTNQNPHVPSATAAFFEVLSHQLSSEPGVEAGSGSKEGFGAGALKVNGKIFAMVSNRGALVLKLPAHRVSVLVEAAVGVPFDPGHGRRMKEWIELDGPPNAQWTSIAREALSFVGTVVD